VWKLRVENYLMWVLKSEFFIEWNAIKFNYCAKCDGKSLNLLAFDETEWGDFGTDLIREC
jgi:hypothetical protein